jgi:hypothetical protein
VQSLLTRLFLARVTTRTLVTTTGASSIRTLTFTASFRAAAWAIASLEGGTPLGGTAAATTTSTESTATATKAWPQLVLGQFAVFVFVELLECGDSALDFLGGNLTIAILVQRGHHRKHPHETAGAAGLWTARSSFSATLALA